MSLMTLFMCFSPTVLSSPVAVFFLLFAICCLSTKVWTVSFVKAEHGLFLNERGEGSRYTCSS